MKYDMVFEGGGAKGMVFVGAMEVFEAEGHTHGRLLGTSAGAITASLLAAGYQTQEMLESLSEKVDGRPVFEGFMAVPPALAKGEIHSSATRELLRNIDLPFIPERFEEKLDDQLVEWLAAQPSLRCVFSFVERGGWYSAENFLAWLKQKLDSGTNLGQPRQYSHMTLAQFHEATGKDLSLVAADTTRGVMLVLNRRTAPDLPLVWAVRMSMSVPLLWQEVVWKPEWGQYRGRDMHGHSIVDGGLLSNFPIELLVSRAVPVVKVMGEDVSEHVLGMMIDEKLEVSGAESAPAPPSAFSLGELATVQRISNLINTATSARDKSVIDEFEHLVVRLPAKGYGMTEFDMSDERRELLVEAGRRAMKDYFTRSAQLEAEVSFGMGSFEEAEDTQQKADNIAMKILE
jgi:predicted acylesterase/phospholipase RssA